MSDSSHRRSISEIISDLGTLLRTPIPGADFLDTVIPIPNLGPRGKPGRRVSRTRNAHVRSSSHNFRTPTRGDHVQAPTFRVEGALRRIQGGHIMIDGEEIHISESTWIFGQLESGSHVTVSGEIDHGGRREARKIIVVRGPAPLADRA